jgi:adenylate cyclase
MAILDTIKTELNGILETVIDERSGTVIPESESVLLRNGAVNLTATFLYADLAQSSVLARLCPWKTTAKIIRCYLDAAVRLIRHHGGEIRSFDGDRVMGIFIGDSKNTDAVNCARKIDWVVTNIINPKVKANFESIRTNNITIKHCIGVDVSEARAVRAGIRSNNDLIWIGDAPSFAAKLSDIRDYPYEVYISSNCYNKMLNSAKTGDNAVWSETEITVSGNDYKVYCTDKPLQP